MRKLGVVEVASGAPLGTIGLSDADELVFTAPADASLVARFRGPGVTDAGLFRLLAGGWSNGYIQIVGEDLGAYDDAVEALLVALFELDGTPVVATGLDDHGHLHGPDGRFIEMIDRIKNALTKHRAGDGKGDPLKDFNREQLRRVARDRKLTLRRGASRDEIAKALADDLGDGHAPDKPATPAKKAAPKTPDKSAATGPEARIAELRGMSKVDARDALDNMTRPEVYALAQHLGEKGQSKARKRELVDLVLTHHGGASEDRTVLRPSGVPDGSKPATTSPEKPKPPKVADGAAARSTATAMPDTSLPSDVDPEVARRFVEAEAQLRLLRGEARRTSPLRAEVDRLSVGISWQAQARLMREAEQEAEIRQWAEVHYPGVPLERVKERVESRVREAFADKDIAFRTTAGSLTKILAGGRVKTQFETGKASAGATYHPELRGQVEASLFGYDFDMDPKARPIYGYVALRGIQPAGYVSRHGHYSDRATEDLLSAYGDVQVILRPEVRSRTTAQIGDTIDAQVVPGPVDAPTWRSASVQGAGAADWMRNNSQYQIPFVAGRRELDYESAQFGGQSYAEAQIHGGVTADDIAEVILPKEPTPALRVALERRGIPWRVL